jgi:hypothetical protein
MNKLQNFMDQLKLGQALPTSNNVLDPNITADELANQYDNPLFVAPNEFAATELADVQTQRPIKAFIPSNDDMQQEVSDMEDADDKANVLPDVAGTNENEALLPASGNILDNVIPDQPSAPPAPQTEYEKLQAKMQELRDLEAAQNETASKYNFGAKAAGIIGDTLARYNTGGIQKNAKANIQYTGPKLQEMLNIIGEVKAPGTASQRAELLKEYELLKKAQGGGLSEYQKQSLELRQRQLDAGDKGLGLRKDKFEHARSEGNELKGKEAETLYGIESTIDSLDKLEGMKTFSTGPIEGRINQAMRYIGQGSGNKAAMAAQLEGIVSVYGKQISGTAVGEQEFNRIKSQLPKETDSDELFASKLANFQDNLGNSRGRFLNHYEKVGRDVNQFKERAPLSEVKGEAPAAPAAKRPVVQNGNRFDAETGKFLGKAK